MPDSLQLALRNDSDSSNLFCYISGTALNSGRRCFIKADRQSLYFPSDPPAVGSPLLEDVAISLGRPGDTNSVTLPQMAGGRVWICEGHLTFLLNPGPALVEPSVLNPSDPNALKNFGFCEFTLDNDQLFANISYVDFVPRIPISISLQQASGTVQHVTGIPPDGIDLLAARLREQALVDHQPWDKLIVESEAKPLRVLNATHANAVNASFEGYYEPYVEQVWARYSSGQCVTIDTQCDFGRLQGTVEPDGQLVIGSERFGKPTTADILGCNSGPFVIGSSPVRNAIIPRLAAAFVRSTLLHLDSHPSWPDTFYQRDPTNHYARILHQVNLDGLGYSFAYDDVIPGECGDQSGKVNASDPVLFTVTVGGKTQVQPAHT